MTPTERGWVAGLFEGEGCISWMSHGAFSVIIGSTDLDVLLRVWAVTGLGQIIATAKAQPHHKQPYRWRVGAREDVIKFLTTINPLLLERRQQRADEALLWFAQNPSKRVTRGLPRAAGLSRRSGPR
jgi:hypothetical protein